MVAQRRAEQMLIQSPKVRALEVAIPVAWRTALRAPSAPTTYRARIVVGGPGGAATLASMPPSAGCSPGQFCAVSQPGSGGGRALGEDGFEVVLRARPHVAGEGHALDLRAREAGADRHRVLAMEAEAPHFRLGPPRRISCMVSEVSAVARGWLPEAGRRSRISGASPRPASSSAAASPAGRRRRPGPGLVLLPVRSRGPPGC